MSDAFATAESIDEKVQNQRVFMQLGFFGLLFLGLVLIADVSLAYGSCTGVASLSGPLLPTVV